MKLGYIGIGNVGGTLAKKLGAKGHTICLGVRDVHKNENNELQTTIGGHATVVGVRDCILKSDIIFLATPWSAVESVIKEHAKVLENKILIDCTNPLKADLSGLTISGEASGAEFIQNLLPKTKVVKAFNTVGFNIMESPTMKDHRAVMYFCGNDSNARQLAKELILDVGFDPIEAGDLKTSRLLEPFALLWISTAYKFGMGRNFAFALIKQ
jgi:8-hydroxy-5-deazaflavin:NADPH oxidoreductase